MATTLPAGGTGSSPCTQGPPQGKPPSPREVARRSRDGGSPPEGCGGDSLSQPSADSSLGEGSFVRAAGTGPLCRAGRPGPPSTESGCPRGTARRGRRALHLASPAGQSLPLRGRWHGEAVTEGVLRRAAGVTPSVSLRLTAPSGREPLSARWGRGAFVGRDDSARRPRRAGALGGRRAGGVAPYTQCPPQGQTSF